MDSTNASTTADANGPLELFLIPTLTTDGVKTLKTWVTDNEQSGTALDDSVVNDRISNLVLIVDHFNKFARPQALSGVGDPYGKHRERLAQYLQDRIEGRIEDKHDPESQFMRSLGDTKLTILMPSSERKASELEGWDLAKAVIRDYTSGDVDEYGNSKSVVPVPSSGGEDSEVATQQTSGTAFELHA